MECTFKLLRVILTPLNPLFWGVAVCRAAEKSRKPRRLKAVCKNLTVTAGHRRGPCHETGRREAHAQIQGIRSSSVAQKTPTEMRACSSPAF